MTTPRMLGRRLRRALHWRRSSHWFISFPKSGRTWTKRILERYYELRYDAKNLEFQSWAPLLRTGAARFVPRLVFSHALTRYGTSAALDRFIATMQNRRVVLQSRDPRAVALTYYFRLVRRMRDGEAARLSFSEFLRHPTLGVERVVEFLDLWYTHRAEFRDFLLLRYEDNVAQPLVAFTRLLEFLGTPVDEALLQQAVAETPDTTRDIEVGGFPMLERLLSGEPEVTTPDGAWRQANLPAWRDVLDAADRDWLQEQMMTLPSALGYREPADAGL